jgi:hypothetical protein
MKRGFGDPIHSDRDALNSAVRTLIPVVHLIQIQDPLRGSSREVRGDWPWSDHD